MKFEYKKEIPGRLDIYLSSQISELSRSKISDLIKAGGVLVNDNEERKPSFQLKAGDVVRVSDEMYKTMTTSLAKKRDLEGFGNSGDESVIKPEKMELNIVHEDDEILVVDKPHGLVVHPGAGNYDGTLVNGIAYHFQKKGISVVPNRVGLVHRLDKQVSGLMVVAKNNLALRFLSDQFSGTNIGSSLKAGKEYWAVVETSDLDTTSLSSKEQKVEGFVFRSRSDRKKYEFDRVAIGEGKRALSYIRVLQKGEIYSLVGIRIKTGRTHQIRTQLKYLGMPIVNDSYYGGRDIGKEGIGLRCVRLEFIHPGVYKKLGVKGFESTDELESLLTNVERVSYNKEVVPLSLKIGK